MVMHDVAVATLFARFTFTLSDRVRATPSHVLDGFAQVPSASGFRVLTLSDK